MLVHLPGTYHPNEQHKEYNEDDSSSDSTSDVRELALVTAIAASKRTGASARRLASHVLHTFAAVVAVVQANICKKY